MNLTLKLFKSVSLLKEQLNNYLFSRLIKIRLREMHVLLSKDVILLTADVIYMEREKGVKRTALQSLRLHVNNIKIIQKHLLHYQLNN